MQVEKLKWKKYLNVQIWTNIIIINYALLLNKTGRKANEDKGVFHYYRRFIITSFGRKEERKNLWESGTHEITLIMSIKYILQMFTARWRRSSYHRACIWGQKTQETCTRLYQQIRMYFFNEQPIPGWCIDNSDTLSNKSPWIR